LVTAAASAADEIAAKLFAKFFKPASILAFESLSSSTPGIPNAPAPLATGPCASSSGLA